MQNTAATFHLSVTPDYQGPCRLCLKLKARRPGAPHLLGFILLTSFTDTLLVVSGLNIVYDCRFWQFCRR